MDVAALDVEAVREALRVLDPGQELPAARATANRALRATLTAPGAVRALLADAPTGARQAFVRLAEDGPARVEDLLDRGWAGRGLLPEPLDWLQRRALVAVDDEGLVATVDEARAGFGALALDLQEPTGDAAPLRLEAAKAVLVAPDAATLDRAVAVPGAGLVALSTTVAASDRSVEVVARSLRGAGLQLEDDVAVAADPASPTLPGGVEEAVGPRAVRTLLERAVAESRQVRLHYFASSRGGAGTERVVDPWSFRDDLLRGWCHLRTDERKFALDRIGRAALLPTPVDHHPAPA